MATQMHLVDNAQPYHLFAARPSRGTGARAMYLDTRPDATFATAHIPTFTPRAPTGLVFCPPSGWHELCTHRSRRAWAEAVADAGHPALRIEYPGTGDSPGSSRSPHRLTACTEAISAAATWLRQELGCSRVCAVGIGFGGMAAWLAIAEGAAVDDLVLWAVPARGRQLLRELSVAAQVSIDERVDFGSDAAAPCVHDDVAFLDESGQVITTETVEAVRAVDLLQTPLPDAHRRRVLCLQRRSSKADRELAQYLSWLGADVALAGGDSYRAMMQYVQQSRTPYDAIERSLQWLSDSTEPDDGTEPARRHAHDQPRITRDVTFQHDDGLLRETPVSLTLRSGTARAVITEPLEHESADLTAVFFSGGSDRRLGPNRAWVDNARAWALKGVTAVRVDPPGVGESDGDPRRWDQLKRHYDTGHTDETVELLDALAARGLPNRFVLVGFCSGSYRSVQVALRDQRVAGVFAINFPFFRWTWWNVNVRDSWLNEWRPQPDDSPLKVRIGRLLQRMLQIAQSCQRRVLRVAQVLPSRADEVIQALDAQQTTLLLLLKRSSYAAEELSLPRRAARIRRRTQVIIKQLPGDDQRFRPLALQHFVSSAMDGALTRVLEAEAAKRGVATDGRRRVPQPT